MATSGKKISILLTGVPGTGKSTVARLLAQKNGASLVDITKLVEVLRLYAYVDEEDGAKVVKLAELQDELSTAIKAEKNVIVEGHLGCEMKLPVAKVVVLRCEPRELRARMAGRNYPDKKIAANALSEALDYCVVNAEKHYGKGKVWEVDTTGKTQKKTLAEVEKILLGKTKRKTHYSWPDALMREAISGEKIRKIMG